LSPPSMIFPQAYSLSCFEALLLWNRTNLAKSVLAVAAEARPRRIAAAFMRVRNSGGLSG
jgi:hypothetical protein